MRAFEEVLLFGPSVPAEPWHSAINRQRPEDRWLRCAGRGPGETLDAALQRLQTTLDAAFPQWRSRLVWSRQARLEAMTGALDYPSTTRRDRPQIDQGQGIFLATDMSASPGLLSEVTVASALTAADHAATYRADISRSGHAR